MTLPSERTSRAIRSGRMNRRPPSFVVTLVALAIIFALAWTFFLRSGPSASAPVVSGLQGTYSWAPAGGAVQTGVFGAVGNGNAGGRADPAAVTLGGQPPLSAYTASTRTESTLLSTGAVRTEVRTVGAWPPVWRLATHSPLDYQGLAAVVRAAVEDGDDTVGIKPLKEGDRPVWRAALTLDGKQIELVVDQQSGIVTWYADGKDAFTAGVDWASPPPAGTTYKVDVPAGTQTKTVSGGVAYAASPAAAQQTAGYAPLVSDLAPDGYDLRATATSRADLRPLSWISDKVLSLPVGPRGSAVLELYTRGLSQFTVEQVGPATMRFWASVPDWRGQATPGRLSYQQTTLQYGAFKGATASTWYQESGPSLFVAGARRAVFVTGALTRQELIAFAEGLKPIPANASR
jgi:hypothetical protein